MMPALLLDCINCQGQVTPAFYDFADPDEDGYVFTKITSKVKTKEDVIGLIRSMRFEPNADS